MVSGTILVTGAIIALASQVSAHASIFTPAMWGFNKTDVNRAQDPLMNCTFDEWWFHGHLNYPPNPGDVEQLPVGGTHNFPTSCDKDATIYWPSGPGGNQQDPSNPDWPCPGQPSVRFHANNISDTAGCGLAVAYKSDVNEVKPDDFTIFSVNHTCVWYLNTFFEIPANMPKCPEGGCICAWFWIHNIDSGSEQMYMTGFRCNMTGAISTTPLPPAQLPRRCGYDKFWDTPADPANCTLGPKLPMYWYQFEGNNMPEDTYHAPTYSLVYGFNDGAQNDIFWPNGDPTNQTYNSTTTSNSANSSAPSNTPVGGNLLASSPPPLPSTSLSSSWSSYPPASSPSSPPSSSSSWSSWSSYPPASSPSSSPAGSVNPSGTLPMSSSVSWGSSYPPKSSYKPSQSPSSSSPKPTGTSDPMSQPKPSSSGSSPSPSSSQKSNGGKCRPRPSSTSSYLPTQSPVRRGSSLEDAPAVRRVWGHRHRGGNV